jgi:hypothetical protein
MSRGLKSQRLSANRFAIETLESRMLLSVSVTDNLALTGVGSGGGSIVSPLAASPTTEQSLTGFTTTTTTAEKPQSKAWNQAGFWWTVQADSTGTWVWRLDGTTWTQVLQVSASTTARADVRNAGNVTHILLHTTNDTTAELASIELVAGGTPSQQAWSVRPTNVTVSLANNVKTATIEMDISGRMWVAYDGTSSVFVRYADSDYSTWSSAITLGTGITSDDIAAISRVGNYGIGVMWSNQNDDRFHFRFHSYLQGATVWGADEFPGAGGALSIGSGLADDHIKMADTVTGDLYVAVKTGYDTVGQTQIGLLVRRANGSWDDMYQVSTVGTRPTVAVDQQRDTVIVAYTNDSLADAPSVYRKSSLGTISFNSATTLISGNHNNVTTTKQRQNDGTLVFLANDSTGTTVNSARITLSATPVSPTVPPAQNNAVPGNVQTPLNLTSVNAEGTQTQSKTWFKASRWWSVMADSTGTWVYRLDSTTWTKVLQISAGTTAVADTRPSGNVTHIFLQDGAANSQLASIELVAGGTPTYQMWSARPTLVTVPLTANTRSATIEIDDAGVLWLAYDGQSNLFVRYALPASNYASWSSPMIMASGVTNDDIITIGRVGSTGVGVMWSNQNADRFGFRHHATGTDPTIWGNDELPGQQANLPIGNGIANSQIHMTTRSDGRLYAVVKTNFNDGIGGQPEIGLLIRYENGVWDPNLFAVDDVGNNAQIVLDPVDNRIVIAYTNASSSKTNNVVYKTSSLNAINFAGKETILPGGWDLVSTTKQNVTSDFVILATNAVPNFAASLLLSI